jgi:ABC transporter with metal-binding/Fe-S-binding domain ATP-binding protein
MVTYLNKLLLAGNMKLAVLFSGGKDSAMALHKAKQKHEIVCLISMFSKNPESYMFHTPNIHIVKLQAQCLELPLIEQETLGEKEKELEDLRKAILTAKQKFKVQGIVTGALASVYQASRIENMCKELELECINPLWQMDQIELLNELVEQKFKVIISGVFAYPLGKDLLGKVIDKKVIDILAKAHEKYKINPAGEGGEIETTVLDSPDFYKQIEIAEWEISYKDNAGVFRIKKAVVKGK